VVAIWLLYDAMMEWNWRLHTFSIKNRKGKFQPRSFVVDEPEVLKVRPQAAKIASHNSTLI
jgi:hypothetical protein